MKKKKSSRKAAKEPAAPKKAAPKKSKKKSAKKPKAVSFVAVRRQVLGRAPEEHSFYVSDGRMVHDLHELAQSMRDMSDEVFRHHVSANHNDFSSWVREVLKDDDLADTIERIDNQMEAEVAVLRRITERLLRK